MASSSARATSSCVSRSIHTVWPGTSRTSSSTTARCVPRPTRRSCAPGTAARRAARRGRDRRRSCRARARRRTAPPARGGSGAGGRSTKSSRSDERRELARRLDAQLAQRAPRCSGEIVRTASARRRPNVPTRSATRRERATQRRAVQPRGRPPVAVHLDDELRPRAREPDERRLVRALRHDRLGPMLRARGGGRAAAAARRRARPSRSGGRPTSRKVPSSCARPSPRSRARAARSAPTSAANFRSRLGRKRQLVACPRRRAEAAASQHRLDDGEDVVGVLARASTPTGPPRRCAPSPSRRRELEVGRASARSPRRAPGVSPCSTSRPLTSSSTMSGIPPARAPTTARPRRNASIATRGSPSDADGSSSARDASSARGELGRLEPAAPRRRPPRASAAATSTCVPSPTRCSRASGTRARHDPPGRGEPLDVLVSLEHADEQHAAAPPAPAPRAPENAPRSE